MAELQTALDQPDIRVEAMEVLRTLIERIVLTPDKTAPNGLAIELFGDLATILNLASSTGQMPGKSAALGAKKKPREAGASEVYCGWLRGHETNLICCFRRRSPGGIRAVPAGAKPEPSASAR